MSLQKTHNIQIDYNTMCVSKSTKWLKEKRKCPFKSKTEVALHSKLHSGFSLLLPPRPRLSCLSAPSQSANMGSSKTQSAGLAGRSRRCAVGQEVCGRHQMHSDLCPVSGDINNFSGAVIASRDAQTEDMIRERSRPRSDRTPRTHFNRSKDHCCSSSAILKTQAGRIQ